MRSLLVAAVMLLVMASVCWAGSPYEDVPTDHWAYNSLDYLAQRGVLEGYPDGFFKGEQTLTRYEFAQAVARLLDTIQVNGANESVKVMAESLRAEFSDQLAEINRMLGEQQAQVADMDDQVGNLEYEVEDNAERLSALEQQIKSFKPGPKWYGVFRYRWQWDSTDYDYYASEDGANTHESYTTDRFRQRIKLHLGMSQQINQQVFAAMELRTGQRTFSAYNDLGVDDSGDANIYLHDAYVKYTPSWFGFYTGADCETCSPQLDIYAGMFPEGNVLTDEAQLLWATDRDMHGLGLVYHYDKDFQINSFAAIIDEQPGDLIDDDVWLLGAEVHKRELLPCFDMWAALYTWRNEDNLPDWYFRSNTYTNPDGSVAIDLNGDGSLDGGDRATTNFTNVKVGAKYTWQCVLPKPVILSGEIMCNIANDADDRIDAYNEANSTNIDYETCDQGAWFAGIQYGTAPKAKGDWMAFAKYKEVGAAATPHGLTDPDTWANVKNLYLYYGWMWEDNCTWGLTYLASNRKNDFGGDIDPDSWQSVKCEWTFNF